MASSPCATFCVQPLPGGRPFRAIRAEWKVLAAVLQSADELNRLAISMPMPRQYDDLAWPRQSQPVQVRAASSQKILYQLPVALVGFFELARVVGAQRSRALPPTRCFRQAAPNT